MKGTLGLNFPQHNRVGLPTKAGLVPDAVRAPTVCKTGVGAESNSGSQVQDPPRLWDYSENSSRDGVLWNHCTETEANDTARPIRAGALPLSSPVPHSCRAKGLFGTRKSPGVTLS